MKINNPTAFFAIIGVLAFPQSLWPQISTGEFPVNVLPPVEKTISSVVLKSEPFNLKITEQRQAVNKSEGKAFLFSLIVPGSGQWYADYGSVSKMKAAGFAVLEGLSWYLVFHYKAKGKKFEKRFENFANTHWDIDKYLAFLENQLDLPAQYLGRKATNNIDKARLYQAETQWGQKTGVSTHHLFGSGMQQYYEMIYKYPEQFALGWSDATVPGPAQGQSPTGYTYKTLTPRMIYYRQLRNESNRFFRYSRNMSGVIMVNHLLSALDASWTVKRRNRAAQNIETSLRVEPMLHSGAYTAKLSLRF